MRQNLRCRHHVAKFLSSSCAKISALGITLDVVLKFCCNLSIMLDMSMATWILPVWNEGMIKVIRSEKAHSLVFIWAILESESLVQQPLSYQLWPCSLIAMSVSLTFSGLLMKAEKHSIIKSEHTRHYTLSPYILKPHFNSTTRSQWLVFQPSWP